MENSQLSTHDKDVLTRIFNPSLPYGDTLDEEIPTDVTVGDDTLLILCSETVKNGKIGIVSGWIDLLTLHRN